MSAKRGEKAALLAHLAAMHNGNVPATWSFDRLAAWHAHEHHHYAYSLSHYHAGPNLGPSARPPGWRTGADPIPREGTR